MDLIIIILYIDLYILYTRTSIQSIHKFNANVGFYCPQKAICLLLKKIFDPPTYDTTNVQLK